MEAVTTNTISLKKGLLSKVVSYLSLDYSLSFIMGELSDL